jgi:hypothetical protein
MQADNLARLTALNWELIAWAESINCHRRMVLDMDSREISAYGEQEHSAYMATSSPPVIIHCCCSIVKATAWRSCYGRATSTAPRLRRTAAARDRAAASAGQGGGLPRRRGLCQAGALRGAERTRREVRHSPSGQRQAAADHCGVADPANGKAQPQAGGSVQELSPIRRPIGRRRGERWRRWSSTLGSCSPALGSL